MNVPDGLILVDAALPVSALRLPADFDPDPVALAGVVESVGRRGVLEPPVVFNRRDDGTYEVRIGCKRARAAQVNRVASMRCIVNCIVGQRFVPEGRRLETDDDVTGMFVRPGRNRLSMSGPRGGSLGTWDGGPAFGDGPHALGGVLTSRFSGCLSTDIAVSVMRPLTVGTLGTSRRLSGTA